MKYQLIFFIGGAIYLLTTWVLKSLIAPDSGRSGMVILFILFFPFCGAILSAKKYLHLAFFFVLCIAIGFSVGEYMDKELGTLSIPNMFIITGIGGLLGLLEYGVFWIVKNKFKI